MAPVEFKAPLPMEHLCVLVHGLWGNPKHLDFVASSLRKRYPQDSLHILQVSRNSGSFTYDGIELGAERVTREVEEKLEQLEAEGRPIKKLSVVGYSLGGLVARYAIGLLYYNKWFEKMEPLNFTTFATPHLGVRTPLTGIYNRLFNVIGARTLSKSGHQLFLIDKFRETGKPLLSVMTEPSSIFMDALARFKNHNLYTNIVNDRSAVYYTTSISRTDPYADLSLVELQYLKNYEPTILNPDNPFTLKGQSEAADAAATASAPLATTWSSKTLYPSILNSTRQLQKLPFYAFLVLWVPLGLTVYFINAGVQSFQSQKRIRLHQQGRAGVPVGLYSIPLAIERAGEELYEEMNQRQREEYLADGDGRGKRSTRNGDRSDPDDDDDDGFEKIHSPSPDGTDTSNTANTLSGSPSPSTSTSSPSSPFPTLALTPAQFDMIAALDRLGWRKYPVHIQRVRHSHAAMIRRLDKPGYEEGSVVVGHWVDEFEI